MISFLFRLLHGLLATFRDPLTRPIRIYTYIYIEYETLLQAIPLSFQSFFFFKNYLKKLFLGEIFCKHFLYTFYLLDKIYARFPRSFFLLFCKILQRRIFFESMDFKNKEHRLYKESSSLERIGVCVKRERMDHVEILGILLLGEGGNFFFEKNFIKDILKIRSLRLIPRKFLVEFALLILCVISCTLNRSLQTNIH